MPPIPFRSEDEDDVFAAAIERSYATLIKDTPSKPPTPPVQSVRVLDQLPAEPTPQVPKPPTPPVQSVRVLDQLPAEPTPQAPETGFEPYAEIAQQAYKEDRQNTSSHTYLPSLSSEDLAVYENDQEQVVGVRGTSKKAGLRDYIRDAQVALGSISTLSGLNFVGDGIDDVAKLVEKLKKRSNKKVHVTGHSLGGSIASFYGIDNPDVDITTFNKGTGLPFITDVVKCTVRGCKNIKNYRIAGDFASIGSKFDTTGEFRSLKPVRPTPEAQDEAALAEGYFISRDLYLPHSMSNFIGREHKTKLDPNLYARTLAQKVGRGVGAVLPAIATAATSGLASRILTPEQIQSRVALLPEWGDVNLQDLKTFARNLGIDPEGPANQRISYINPLARTGQKPILNEALGEFELVDATADLSSLLGQNVGTQTGLATQAGLAGLGIQVGELAGLAAYEAILASDEP